MRKETKALQNIRTMYVWLNLYQEDVFHRTKQVLAVYRDAVWSVTKRADNMACEAQATYGQNLDAALTYLADFAPTERRQEFESKVTYLFETKWLIELVDTAMLKIYEYYPNGQLYYDILFKCYIGRFGYSEKEMLDFLNMERSTFYDRKKEATMLIGVALWGYAIPSLQGVFNTLENGADVPAFFK